MINISAILPTFNCQTTIELALRSLVHQRVPTGVNYRIYIYDDGSNDNTPHILKRFQYNYPDLIELFISERNNGIVHALNSLISFSNSDYYMRMDSDDFCTPDRLILTYEKITEGYDIVGTAIQCFGNSSSLITYPCIQSEIEIITTLDQRVFCHPAITFSNKVAKLRYTNETAEDYDLLQRCLIKNLKVTNISNICLFYRVHKKSLSSSESGKYVKLRESVLRIRTSYIAEKFNFDKSVALKISEAIENSIFKRLTKDNFYYLNIFNCKLNEVYAVTLKFDTHNL